MTLCKKVDNAIEPTDSDHISIYGFKTENDLNNDNETHIDSITQEGDWKGCAESIVFENSANYYYISVQDDNGKHIYFE